MRVVYRGVVTLCVCLILLGVYIKKLTIAIVFGIVLFLAVGVKAAKDSNTQKESLINSTFDIFNTILQFIEKLWMI